MASPATANVRRSGRRRLGLGIGIFVGLATLALLALLPWFASPYVLSLMFLVYLFVTLSCGWNLFSGYTGYVNFGYAVFVGVGSYAMAILITRFQLHWLAAIPTASVMTVVVALILGLPLLRIRGVYFAIAMLGVATAVTILAASRFLAPITQGGVGIPLRSGMPLATQYYVVLVMATASIATSFAVANSRFGLQLLAIREDELSAQVMGIQTGLVKLSAFALSAFFAGAAGAVQAAFLSYIDPPSAFDITYTVRPIVMVLFGGPGTVFGPMLGATVFTLLSEIIWAQFLRLHLLIFGVLLIALVLGMPQGIIPWLQYRRLLPRTRKL